MDFDLDDPTLMFRRSLTVTIEKAHGREAV